MKAMHDVCCLPKTHTTMLRLEPQSLVAFVDLRKTA